MSESPPRWVKFAPWLLTAVVLCLLLPGTATLPLLDRDEPRFATATREMMERHDWIVPTFNGAERFDKPALTYWLMRVGYALCGVGELGARLPAVVAALALVLLTWHTGRRWFGEAAGLLAGFALATCLQVLIHGRLAVADMPMVACVALVQVGVLELLTAAEGTSRRGWWWATWLALGAGFLAKGPIVVAVPLLTLALHRLACWRRPLPWARLGAGRGIALALLMVAAWGVPALIVTEGRFWKVGIGEHVIQRGFGEFNDRRYTPWFYLATAPLSLFPWIALAGAVVAGARKFWDERAAWLVSWLVAPYVIFTCYKTQLPHYVLPAFPAFFLLLGRGFGEVGPRARRAGEIFIAMISGVVLVGGALVLAADLPENAESLRGMFVGALLMLLGLAMLPWAAWRRNRILLAAGLLIAATGTVLLASGMRATSFAVNARARWQTLPVETRFVGYGMGEPSLVFYSGRHWVLLDQPAELAAELAKPGPLVVLTLVRDTDPLGFFIGSERTREVTRPPELTVGSGRETEYPAFNPGRTRWQVVREWRRE